MSGKSSAEQLSIGSTSDQSYNDVDIAPTHYKTRANVNYGNGSPHDYSDAPHDYSGAPHDYSSAPHDYSGTTHNYSGPSHDRTDGTQQDGYSETSYSGSSAKYSSDDTPLPYGGPGRVWPSPADGSRNEDDEITNECARLTKFTATVRIIPEQDMDLNRHQAFPFLINDILKDVPKSHETTKLMRGPLRVLKLCLFAVVIPLFLVMVPLYVRLVLYPPHLYPMAPTDQRLIDNAVSTVWCQGQRVEMNGTFNAYVVPDSPGTSRTRPRYSILKQLKLKDDVKEYWGFSLREGSTVTLSACTRYDGGQLMILRGSENLRRCAWIGEEDSLEEESDSPPTAEDIANIKVSNIEDSDEYEDSRTNRLLGSRTYALNDKYLTISSDLPSNIEDITSSEQLSSKERKLHVNLLLKKALRFSKGKKELMNFLNTQHSSFQKQLYNDVVKVDTHSVEITNEKTSPQTVYIGSSDSKSERKTVITNSRSERSLSENSHDGAFEEVDDDVGIDSRKVKKYTRQEIDVEQIIGGVSIPKGLTYERGFMHQTNGNDLSMEEHRSSYSSSEEALASCEGVILALPLRPDSQCKSFDRQGSNKISYDISIDGTYYFVFSSDNEIISNDMFFNLTFDKVVYDTSDNLANCTAANNCSLSLNFWSDDKTVVEVPSNERWDDSFVLRTNCEPRVAVYFCLLLLVPILILFCAFQ